MKTVLNPLEKAIYERLIGDASLMGVITAVYDDTPMDATFPYALIGHVTSIPYDSKTFDGEEVTATMHAWSDKEGFKQVNSILDYMLQALTDATLSIPGFYVAFSRLESMQTFDEAGGDLKHGVLILRYKISQ
jgi:hypothetical protein